MQHRSYAARSSLEKITNGTTGTAACEFTILILNQSIIAFAIAMSSANTTSGSLLDDYRVEEPYR